MMETTSSSPPRFAADPHSFARPHEARVKHVALELDVRFDVRRLEGRATLDLDVAPGAHEVVLDTRDLEIESVTDGAGAPLSFTLSEPDPLLGSALTVVLSPGATRVSIRYRTGPDAEALQWLDPEQTAGGAHPFLFTQGHAILTRTWIPTQDSPGIRQTYEALITVPQPLVAVMSAEHFAPIDASLAEKSARTYPFQMRSPVPPHLFALAVGDLDFRAIGTRAGVFAEPCLVERARHEFEELPMMMDAAEAIGGPYRWDRLDIVVMPPSFPYGGMENPRLTFASSSILAGDRSLTTLVAHELAHAWAGNLVMNATWNDFWLNEGFTVYFELRINEALYGAERAAVLETHGTRELAAEIERLGPTSPDTRLYYDMTGRDPAVGVTSVPYIKGAAFLRAVEEAVSRERFDPWLRGYFDRYAFASLTTDALVLDMREHLFGGDRSMEAKLDFDRWIHAPGLPPARAKEPPPALASVEVTANAFLAGAKPSASDAAGWTAQQWRHFLGILLSELPSERLDELDAAFSFSESTNAEVLFAWLRLAARSRHAPVVSVIERFLSSHGRGKYVRPLYAELMATEWGAPIAQRIYETTRPRYHSLVRGAVDKLMSQKRG